MRRFCTALVFLCLFAPAAVAVAEEDEDDSSETYTFEEETRLIFEARSTGFNFAHSSFDALTDYNAHPTGHFGVGYGLSEWVPGLRGYVYYAGTGLFPDRFGGELDMRWRRDMFLLAVDYGPEFWGFLRPSVRGGLGYALQTLDVWTDSTNKRDTAHDPVAFGSVGLEAYTSRWLPGSARAGLMTELGYLLQTPANFDGVQTRREDDEWDRQPADYGNLHTSGLFWSLGIGLQFDL
ncbi:MAG: hypothetical protein ACOCV2_10550 [Persicimonas sp.]